MSCESAAICLTGVGKEYKIYEKPIDRLRAMFPWNRNKPIGKTFHALQEIDLRVEHGEVIGIIGRNGAGKSTLLQIVAQTIAPSYGEARTNGKVAALLELGSGFNPEFSGRENVYLAAAIAGLSAEETKERFDAIVEFSGIGEFIDQPVKNYSSGMMVRLAFSVATSVEPDILIVDEALSVGDGAFARKSFDRIMSLKERGCTILFCSHTMHQIEMICSKVIWINQGRIEESGAPSKVIPLYNEFLNKDGQIAKEVSSETRNASKEVTKAKIEKVIFYCDGEKSEHPKVMSGESDLRIRIDIKSAFNLPAPTVSITFDTSDFRMATSLTTYGNIDIPIDENGNGSVNVTFPKIPLLRGKYYISVYLMCEQCILIYDEMPHLFVLDVEQKSFEQGIFKIERQWSL